MTDTKTPEINKSEPPRKSVEEYAKEMFSDIQDNLLKYVAGEDPHFRADFVTGYDNWLITDPDSHERIHGLAFEKFYALNESRIFEEDSKKYIAMTITDAEECTHDLVFNLDEVRNGEQVLHITITS